MPRAQEPARDRGLAGRGEAWRARRGDGDAIGRANGTRRDEAIETGGRRRQARRPGAKATSAARVEPSTRRSVGGFALGVFGGARGAGGKRQRDGERMEMPDHGLSPCQSSRNPAGPIRPLPPASSGPRAGAGRLRRQVSPTRPAARRAGSRSRPPVWPASPSAV